LEYHANLPYLMCTEVYFMYLVSLYESMYLLRPSMIQFKHTNRQKAEHHICV